MKRTVLAMLDEASDKYADLPYAFKKTDAGYVGSTFREVAKKAQAFAAWIVAQGYTKGDKISLVAEGSPEWLVAELGALRAGLVSVPLSIKLVAEEIAFRLEHSESKLVCTTHNQLEKTMAALTLRSFENICLVYLDDDIAWAKGVVAKQPSAGHTLVALSDVLSDGNALLSRDDGRHTLQAVEDSIQENDVVTISYTSGTTGNPKGIMLTHLNYWSNCHDAVELFDNPLYFKTLLILPLDHSFAHTVGLYTALLCGISLYFVDSRGGGIATLRNIPVNLQEANPTFLLTVPSLTGNFMKKIIAGIEEKGGFVEKLFKSGIEAGIRWNGDGYHTPGFGVRASAFFPYFLAKSIVFGTVKKAAFGKEIRFCVGGGASLDLRQQQFFAALGAPVYQGYGLTEAAPIISSNTIRKHKFGSSGILAPSVHCAIMDENGKELPTGEVGQITVTGENVMLGYYKNPEATSEALAGGRLWTGDLGFMDEDGFLWVVGRAKALLIREDGEKYSPEEIEETVANSTDFFEQLMVWCDHRKYVIALVVLDDAKVRGLVAKRGITSAEELLKVLVDEFYRFKKDASGKKIQSAWIPVAFQIVDEPFSEENGTINSTLKLVRQKVSEKYADYIDYSYTTEGSTSMNKRNLALLAKRFGLK
jgi:long-chain acyl-CoA synthetase